MTGAVPAVGREPEESATVPTFEEIYDGYFDFVWRSLRRLGVPRPALDDAVQETFLVVHRRLPEFEGRASLKTWIFGVALRIAQRARRSQARQRTGELPPELEAHETRTPHEEAIREEGIRVVYAILDRLAPEKREVFVMAELEQFTAPEIAEITGVPLNTIYARLRVARREFEASIERFRAKERWR
jgi:RNA polymerase sigma-70 factor (ECF subfamily)